ncbi:MAG: rhodanese-like domain-containing protein [Sulfurospirillaceae bacterium]|nr:rhodanese-like domain-containing protein [Sulfurospirillaceae bacterium]MDD2825717.1 rhodanese-like domain-containing protein [Sulfurospirillaceae bacterium]
MYKKIGLALIAATFLMTGCATATQAPVKTDPTVKAEDMPFDASKINIASLTAPLPRVVKYLEEKNIPSSMLVEYPQVREAIGNGTKQGAKALLLDARPTKSYLVMPGIPASLNVPGTAQDAFDSAYPQIEKVAKDAPIIVHGGGYQCLYGPRLVTFLQAKGFTNVKLYLGSTPEYIQKPDAYKDITVYMARGMFTKNEAVFLDARPYAMFMKETIPGAQYMNDTEFEKLKGRLPVDLKTPIVAFCGGYECAKSHNVAKELKKLGYKNVSTFSGGLPAWKELKLPTTGGAQAEAPKVAVADKFLDGVKLGLDEGTVDGEWYKAAILSGKLPANVAVVDVRTPSEYKSGHLPGAINIEAGELSADAFLAKLPKDKIVVFSCATGGRAMEAWMKLNKAKLAGKALFFDANLKCGADKCDIKVNEPLG